MYGWLVFIHLVGLVLFAASHGVSMYAAFAVRANRDPGFVGSVLGASKLAVGLMYVGLLLLAAGGLGAAWSAGLLLAPWIVASYVVLIAIMATMYALGTPYYVRLRELVGADTVDRQALDQALDTRRPEILASVGATGLLVLVFLMVIKPGA